MKIKFDVVEVEVADALAPAVEKHLASLTAKADAAKAEAEKAAKKVDGETARADALAKELEAAKAQIAEAPKKVRAELAARAKLEDTARKVCGAEAKVDGVDDKGLRKLIAATQAPSGVNLDEKSDAYLDALIDHALAKLDQAAEVQSVVAATRPVEAGAAQAPKTVEEVAAAMFERASASARAAK